MGEMLTRERIIQFLQMYRQASAADMADAMGMTRANLRYHLDSLIEAGVIEYRTTTKSAGRGRPSRVFRLTASGRPNNFDGLAGALLTVLLSPGLQQEEIETRLQELAQQMTPDMGDARAGLAHRLNRVVQWLDGHHYASAWEARPQGPVIRLRNCPYAAQVRDHPELCRMDALVIERLSGMSARQEARIDLAGGTTPACVFALKHLTSSDVTR